MAPSSLVARDRNSEMDIYQIIAPFHVAAKLFGISCFEIRTSVSLIRRRVLCSLNVTLMIVCVSVCTVMYKFSSQLSENVFNTNIGRRFYTFLFMASGLLHSSTMIMNFCMRNTVRRLFRELNNFDIGFAPFSSDEANYFGKQSAFVKFYLCSAVTILLLIQVMTFCFLRSFEFEFKISLQACAFIFVSLLMFVLLLSHIVLAVAVVFYRFKHLNRAFKKKFLNSKVIPLYSCQVIKFRVMHDCLNDAVELINLAYSFQVGGSYITFNISLRITNLLISRP